MKSLRASVEPLLGSRLIERSLPLCPEIRLWLLGDDVDLNGRVADLLQIETAPYWAFCWCGGQAIARFVFENAALVRGKHVVDFGAGSGVAAIAAALCGASQVTAVDIDPISLEACEQNAKLNGVTLDMSLSVPDNYDLLLAADILYEVGLYDFLKNELLKGHRAIVADPMRHGNARIEREPDAQYVVKTIPDVDYPVARASIWVLNCSADLERRAF